MADNPITILHRLRASSGPKETVGLSDGVIEDFCASDAELVKRFTRLENSTMHFSTNLVKTSCLCQKQN